MPPSIEPSTSHSARTSENLRPGMKLRDRDGRVVTLRERKDPREHRAHDGHFWPGWWLVEGGGLADFVIDDGKSWTVLDA